MSDAKLITSALLEDDEIDPKDYVMRSLPGLIKFIVISWDASEEQVFWDVIMARDTGEARDEVASVRDYADVVDVLSMEEIRHTLLRISKMSPQTVISDWTAFKKDAEG